MHRLAPWSLVFLAVTACGSTGSAEPNEPVTVLVTNNSCAAGRCMTLELRTFIWAFAVPQHPWGSRVVGYAPPGTSCITLPDTIVLRLNGSEMPGVDHVTLVTWERSDPAGIALNGLDSLFLHGDRTQGQVDSVNAGLPPYRGNGPSVGRTVTFVPGNHSGWRTSFPSTGSADAQITAAPSCRA